MEKSINVSRDNLQDAVRREIEHVPNGDKIKTCLQCGTCSGTCPVSYAMDMTPRRMIALYRAGEIQDVLTSRSLWLCASCYSCTVRCPMDIKITDMIYALKRVASKRGITSPHFPVHKLSKAFVRQIYRYGRNWELGLGAEYFLRARFVKLFTSAGYGWGLFRRGRLALLPGRIRRIRDVRAIIQKANQLGAT